MLGASWLLLEPVFCSDIQAQKASCSLPLITQPLHRNHKILRSQYLSMELVIFPILTALSLQTAMIQMSKGKHFETESAKCKVQRYQPGQLCRMGLGLQIGQEFGKGLLPGSWVDGQATWLIVQDGLLLEESMQNRQRANTGLLNVLSQFILLLFPFSSVF